MWVVAQTDVPAGMSSGDGLAGREWSNSPGEIQSLAMPSAVVPAFVQKAVRKLSST